MKIRVERHSILGIAMALFVFSLMAYQSSHRFFEHHDDEEGEHEECSLCDWQFAPIETARAVEVQLFTNEFITIFEFSFTDKLVSNHYISLVGRGPPAA